MPRKFNPLGLLLVAATGWWLVGGEKDETNAFSASSTETIVLRQVNTDVPRNSPKPKSAEPEASKSETASLEPAAVATPMQAELFLYTRTSARVRSEPNTSSPIVSTLPPGEAVRVVGLQGEWHRVTAIGFTGWIRRDLLTDRLVSPKPVEQPRVVTVPKPLYVQPQRSEVPLKRRSNGSTPIRDAYVGTCDCPYDRMRNGRLCGGRSAYSKPGGRSPVCYE